MSFLAVVFVVLMILAVVCHCAWNRPAPDVGYLPMSGWFLLWLCVAILGYIVLSGNPQGPMQHIH